MRAGRSSLVSTIRRIASRTGVGALDLATRKIVGWAMRDNMRAELPPAALMMAAQRQRPAPGLIHHSDRGSQYAAGAYVDHLAAIGATSSMSRIGNCYDNARMESFFHTLKVNWSINVAGRRTPRRDRPCSDTSKDIMIGTECTRRSDI